ncbi:MAG: hypothetical protein JXR37_36750 [Kiritimatiellae bacterium]|nr:hypothetical protein [Kiritimatiellia bacterium]
MLRNQTRLYESNLSALRQRMPGLAAKVDAFPGQEEVRIFRAKDGGVAYGHVRDGRVVPLTDPATPLTRIRNQLQQHARRLADYTMPVLVVGLCPGNELLAVFDNAENDRTPHAAQPIYVCVDSLPCLYAFLQTWDATRVLAAPRVHFFLEQAVADQVDFLRNHPERPHVFTLISGASDQTLDRIMPPFVALVEERNAEMDRLRAENDAYYDAVDDNALRRIIAGDGSRKPRLLMPTCTWSTFIQHSTRDTAAAFKELGWEVRILRMASMLTPYYLVKQIHTFKPDVFLFIDHLRYEAEEVYPRNMMFVSWIQDEMKHIHCREAGAKIAAYAAARKRDLVVGYTKPLVAGRYGYPEDRLVEFSIPADPRLFHPVALTPEDARRYGCELAFVTNTSMPTEQIVDERIVPRAEPLGVSRAAVEAVHDHLWAQYRAGRTFADRNAFLAELMTFPELAAVFERQTADGDGAPANLARPADAAPDRPRNAARFSPQADEIFQLLYWRLNDAIYRHVVLEWADELGVDLHLYGRGWEQHPRFGKYACGVLEHGDALNKAYNGAKLNLHLNISQGMHQRIWEILAAGRRMLMRDAREREPGEPPLNMMQKLAVALLRHPDAAAAQRALSGILDDPSASALNDWVFRRAYAVARADADPTRTVPGPAPLEERLIARIRDEVLARPDWLLTNWVQVAFTDRAGFEQRLRDAAARPPVGGSRIDPTEEPQAAAAGVERLSQDRGTALTGLTTNG